MHKFGQELIQAKIVDLTHTLAENVATWPGSEPFQRKLAVDYPQGCRVYNYCQAAGVGTHIDAPVHFIPEGRSIDNLKLVELVVPACVIDVRQQVAVAADYAISKADIISWEQQYGLIPTNSAVLALTGWSERWHDTKLYRNMDANGVMHFPGFSVEAAEFLVERKIAAVGIDTLSPDSGNQLDFPVHHVLLGADKYIIENLTNLAQLPPVDAILCALPMKIAGGTEAGARVIAFYNPELIPSS